MGLYCRHDDCRIDAAIDLAWIAERLKRGELMALALGLRAVPLEVRCRHLPRPAHTTTAPSAPLPGVS